MSRRSVCQIIARAGMGFLLTLFGATMASAAEYFDSSALAPDSPALDLGNQPLAYSAGVVGAAFDYDGLRQVFSAPARHRLCSFSYDGMPPQ